MATSIHNFLIELYEEYLEEASFLYKQRLSLFDDPEITWLDIEDFEERFEPHIDGLVVGEGLALEVCKTQAFEGDFGELNAAIRVFCRQNRQDTILEILKRLDPTDSEKVKAVIDALKYELPEGWQDDFLRMLLGSDQKLVDISAQVAGYRRLSAGRELLQAMQDTDSTSLPSVIWAIGRLREKQARPLLLNRYLQNEDEIVSSTSALALLRIGEPNTISYCLNSFQSKKWTFLPLGLSGDRSVIPVLHKILSESESNADCLLALGMLGDVSSIETLLFYLSDTELMEAAARSLNLITGAELYEEVFVPEEIEENELFEEELEKFKQGEVPKRPDGKPFGTTITRISQKIDDWQRWWAENTCHFDPKIRYRNGKPYSPACLLENLESEKSPRKIRQLAYEELVIRYGIDFPFETDMFLAQQKQALRRYSEWIKTNGTRFHEGKWYFAGKLVAS